MSDVNMNSYAEKNIVASTDKALGLDGNGDTKLLTFKNAVESEVQTSLTDTTDGRLMKVGAFGMPTTILSSETDLNNYTISGRYLTPSVSLTNQPSSFGSDRKHLIVDKRDALIFQMLFQRSGGKAAYRIGIDETSFNDWREFYHSGNYPSDSAWTTSTSLLNGWTGTVNYIKRAGWVIILLEIDGTAKSDNTFFTIPSEYRPSTQVNGVLYDAAANTTERVFVDPNGSMDSGGTTALLRGSITCPII